MNRFACLLYHGLANSPPSKDYLALADFEQQLIWLRSRGYVIDSFPGLRQKIESRAWPERYLVMSFDDGHVSNLRAAERLAETGAAATFFIVKNACEGPGRTYLRPQQVRELAETQDIGSHSVSHQRLSRLSTAQLHRELADSKSWLEDLCGKPVTAFSAPLGDFDTRAVRMALELGYSLFATSASWWNRPGAVTRNRVVARTSVERYATMAWFNHVAECQLRPFLSRRIRLLLAAPLKKMLPRKAIKRLRGLVWR